MLKKLSLLLASVAFTSCASLNSAYMTNMSTPASQGKKIEAEASKTIILGMSFDNDFAQEITSKLVASCPQGKITGVYTTSETYFYFLAYKEVLKSTAYCVQN